MEYLHSGNGGNNRSYYFTDLFNELFYESSNGVNENILNSLPKIKVDDDSKLEQDKCVICLENFKKGDELIITPCIHCFHSNCIKEWLKIIIHAQYASLKLSMNCLIHDIIILFLDF